MRGGVRTRLAQRGQALVFVTIVMLVVMLALVTMYSMGQLTTEKMKLQNTADAAAYSSALAQARDYNFSAYVNRAMIANQVVIAQLVGLTSWARNYNDTFATLTPQVEWMAQGIVGRLMWSLPIRGLRPAARTFNRIMDATAPILVKALYVLIDGLGYAQTVYHVGTALTVAQQLGAESKAITFLGSLAGLDWSSFGSSIASVLALGNNYNIIKLNDPDAVLSTLGLAAWAYNTYEWFGFTDEKDPTKKKGSTGKGIDGKQSERFAKVTTSSMDGFYDKRTLPWVPFPWPLPSALIDPTFIVGMPRVYGFTMLLFHTGGTELRNDNKTWSAQDTTAFFGLVTVPIFIPPFGPFINIPIIPWIIPPMGAPAGGAAQAGVSSPINPVNNFNRDNPASYKAMADAYGQSFSGAAFPSFGLAARMQQGKGAGATMGQLPTGTRGGLRKYRDVKNIEPAADPNPEDNTNNSSPPIIVEIEKPSSLIATSATGKLRIGRAGSTDSSSYCGLTSSNRLGPTVTALAAKSNLDVGDGTASNCMRALSKAEAYFSRPSDIYGRADGKTEYGSLYSPYWQARLLPNNLLEQAASMLFQGLNFSSIGSWIGSTY